MTPSHILKWTRSVWFAATGVLIVATIARPLSLSLATHRDLMSAVDYLYDDAYYYLRVAANIADSSRSTFDGTTLTNGYHPLWLLALTALAKAVGTTPWAFFVATCWLIAVIAASGALMAWVWRRQPSAEVAFLAGTGLAIAILEYREIFLYGMEPILLAPLLVPLIVLVEAPVSDRALFALSGLLALAFLARIDGLVIFGAVALLLLMTPRLEAAETDVRVRGSLKSLVKLGAITVPVVAVYLAVNLWVFRTAVPVSGLAKSIDGPKFANWGVFHRFLGEPRQVLVLGIVVPILLALEFTARRAGKRSFLFWRSLLVFFIAAAASATYYSVFSTWPIWPWYAYLSALAFALLMARLVHLSLLLLDQRRMRYVALCLLVVLAVYTAWIALPDTLEAVRYLAAARNNEPKSVRSDSDLTYNQLSIEMLDTFFAGTPPLQVAMGDRAGALSYWGRSRLSVVQAEGLMLDADYIAARRLNRAESYFESRFNIRLWLVDREFVPLVTAQNGARQYVVAEPIQGRVALYPVPVFCFPETALLYRKTYGAYARLSTRFAFSFERREPCSADSLDVINTARLGEGLHQMSLPGEYRTAAGAYNRNKAREDRDRAIAEFLRRVFKSEDVTRQ